jgi:uncharacterized membrane protein (DUF4010 family)
MLVIEITGPGLLLLSFAAVSAVILASYLRTSAAGDVGATTEIAAIGTFLLGVLAGAGQLIVAGAAGVGIAVLLVAKPRLEAFSRTLNNEEVSAVLELAVISVIVLPLLPNQGYGPWSVLNPFHIWLMVVLVSGLSFAGFVAMRLWGERRGLLIAGVVGALVSSTAVTMAMAARSRTDTELAPEAATAAILASTIMCVRVAILGGVVNIGILPRLLPVVAVMTLAGIGAAWIIKRRAATSASNATGAKLANPFSLIAALSFAGVYTLVLVLVQAAHEYFGARGVYIAAGLSALADVDAVTIASARLGAGDNEWFVPATAVTIAAVANTLVKLGIALVVGIGSFRWYVAAALGAMAIFGAIAGMVMFAHA